MTSVIPPTPSSVAAPVLATAAPSSIRNELTDMVTQDLLGPAGGPDEELNQYEDHVFQRYLGGMLAPKASKVASDELDELAMGGSDDCEEGAVDSGVPAGNTFFPSSMGFSFVVAEDTKDVKRPQYFGHITNDIIYRRIAPGVWKELKAKALKDEKGRLKNKPSQNLTPDIGDPRLQKVIT